MEVKHIRKFMPVGHGAFFIERLFVDDVQVLTAVYDCGDSKDGQRVKRFADTEFGLATSPSEKIDVLFISHFDKDHINGLKYLQPYLKRKTRVFLPFCYPTKASIYDENKRVGIEEVFGVMRAMSIMPVLVRFSPGGGNHSEFYLDDYDEQRYGRSISSGQPIVKKVMGIPIWRYVPFNLFNEEKLFDEFEDKVLSEPGWTKEKLEDVKSWTEEDKSFLKDVYHSFANLSINDNSLMVLSDAYGNYRSALHMRMKPVSYMQRTASTYSRPSCLYTGDTVLKRSSRSSKYYMRYEAFLAELKRFVERVSLMQCPHHGSANNINMATLCDCMSHRLFCNFSTSDMTHKTFILTKANLETIWKSVIQVTENDDTVFEQSNQFKV